MGQQNKQASSTEKAILSESLPFLELSKNAYNKADAPVPAGWKVIAATDDGAHRALDGFSARVYERTDTSGQPRYAIAFRGTDGFADINDILANVDIFRRRLPGQYEQAREFVQDICNEKGIDPSDMAFTGHSLGGYLASAAGLSFDSKNIWTFNAPAPSAGTWQKIEGIENNGASPAPGHGWVNIRSSGDLVGKWGNYSGATTIEVDTVGNPHMLDSLRHSIVQTVNGQSVTAVGEKKKGFLSRVFNAAVGISQALAQSPLVDFAIDKLMAEGTPQGKTPARLPQASSSARAPSTA